MPDLEISQLPALSGADIQGTDPVAVADLSASETKKLTIADLATFGVQFIGDDAISSDQIISLDGSKIVANTITATQIAPNAIGSSELADGSVDSAAIQDGAVLNVHLSTGIDGDKLLALSVSDAKIISLDGSKIIAGTIDGSALADGIITSEKLGTDSVNTDNIVNLAVTDAKIASGISGSKILAASISQDQLGAGSVGELQLIDGSVATAKLAAASVTNDKIASGIDGAKITDATITDAKIISLNGSKIVSGTVSGDAIAAGSITNAKLAANAVNTVNVIDGAITDSKIASNINGSKLTDGSVSTTQLADDAVTQAKIADSSVSDDKLLGPINGNKLSAESVASTALGEVTERGLSQGTNNKIGIANSVTAGSQAGISWDEYGSITGATAIPGGDLPIASADDLGAVRVPAIGGLAVTTQGDLSIANSVVPATVRGISYDRHGSITGITSEVPGADLPLATISTVGVVKVPGPNIAVDADGAVTLADSGVTPGIYPKVQVNSKGVVTAGSALTAADIPDISADKITSGEIDARTRILDRSITQIKLADNATAYIQETIPPATTQANYKGCMWFQESTGQLRIFSGNSWLPVGFGRLAQENLRWGGIVDAATGLIVTLTDAGQTAQLIVGAPLPAASDALGGIYLVTDPGGNAIGVTPGVVYDGGDWCLCINSLEGWTRIDTMASGGGGGGSTTLGGLTDVEITDPEANQALVYDGGDGLWKNEDIASAPVLSVFGRTGAVIAIDGDYDLSQIGEVDLTTTPAISGDILKFDGTNFVPVALSAEIPISTLGAGAGLFDSGSNPQNPILNVGAVASGGITVNTDDIQIDRTITDTWYAAFGAEPNVQSNWTETDPNNDSFIQNKPSIPPVAPVASVFGRTGAVVAEEGDYNLTQLGDVDITGATTGQLLKYNGSVWEAGSPGAVNVDLGYTVAVDTGTVTNDSGTNAVIPAASVSGAGLLTSTLFTKLGGIAPGAEVNVQSNWDETNSASDAFIQNKPAIPVIPAAQDLQSVTNVGSHTTNGISLGGADLANAKTILDSTGSITCATALSVTNGTARAIAFAEGQFWATHDLLSTDLIIASNKDGEAQKFAVYGDGGVGIGPSVNTKSTNLISLNADGTGSFGDTLSIPSSSNTALRVGTAGAGYTGAWDANGDIKLGTNLFAGSEDIKLTLNADGAIAAAGAVVAQDVIVSNGTSAGAYCFEARLNNTSKAIIKADGSITADGRITTNNDLLVSKSGGGDITLSDGSAYVVLSGGSTGPNGTGALQIKPTNGGTTVAEFDSLGLDITGSLLTSGTVVANDTIESASGGFRFPDGTTQTTAAVSGAAAGNGALTIQISNGTSQTSGTFTANQSGASTIKLPAIPYSTVTGKPTFATVATTGSYDDLTDKPTIPSVGNGQITIKQGGVTKGTFTTNQSGATSIDLDAGSAPVTPGNGSLTIKSYGAESSATGSFSANQAGSSTIVLPQIRYGDLSGTPSIPSAANNGSLVVRTYGQNSNNTGSFTANQSGTGTITLARIRYQDLSGTPSIPSAQVQTNWNATSGISSILNKPNLATVATSGSYNDLSNKPTTTTNLGNSTTVTTVKITSSSGSDTTLNAATASKAGIMDVNHVNSIATANTNASNALSDASTALSTANSANAAASSAQSTANNAMPKSGGTFTGDVTFSSGKRIVMAGSAAGIVNTSADLILFGNSGVNGSVAIDNGGATINGLGVRYTIGNAWIAFEYASGSQMVARQNGGVWGNVAISGSDRRLKENISSVDSAISIINTLNPVSYTWKDDSYYIEKHLKSANKTRYGFIADEVMEAIPEAAVEQPITEENPEPMKDYDNRAIISLLTKAVQELSAEVAELKQQLAAKD